MVGHPWTVTVAHALGVPSKAHGCIIHLGERQLRQVSTRDLVAQITTLDGPSIYHSVLVLAKEYLAECGVCTGGIIVARHPLLHLLG